MSRSAATVPADQFAVGFFHLLSEQPDRPEEDAARSAERSVGLAIETGATLFPGQPALARAFVKRFIALVEILDSPELAPWRSADPWASGTIRLHPALVAAAAEVKLNDNGKFPRKKLRARTEALAVDQYADWRWDTPD